jgi:hypothetical protein
MLLCEAMQHQMIRFQAGPRQHPAANGRLPGAGGPVSGHGALAVAFCKQDVKQDVTKPPKWFGVRVC